MSDPEIDRRCSACGASVRRRAMFCPQCGQPITQHDELAETVDLKLPAATRAPSESADTIAIDRSELDTVALPSTMVEPATHTISPADKPVAGKQPGHNTPMHERVDRLRKASTVVIEQAHYDPSIRFLLVTAALFILFILLLVLSKLLG